MRIRVVWLDLRSTGSLATHRLPCEDPDEYVNVQADLSVRRVHMQSPARIWIHTPALDEFLVPLLDKVFHALRPVWQRPFSLKLYHSLPGRHFVFGEFYTLLSFFKTTLLLFFRTTLLSFFQTNLPSFWPTALVLLIDVWFIPSAFWYYLLPSNIKENIGWNKFWNK